MQTLEKLEKIVTKIGWINLSYALALILAGFIIARYISHITKHTDKQHHSEPLLGGRLFFYGLVLILLIVFLYFLIFPLIIDFIIFH